jgi:hypothetical protein
MIVPPAGLQQAGLQRVVAGDSSRFLASGKTEGPPAIRTGPAPCRDPVMRNYQQLGVDLERFANRLNGLFETMRTIRPDIVDGSYEVIHDEGRLKVVDSTLDERSIVWLEESLNGDRELVRMAAGFNEQVVRTFDTERGNWDEQGVFRRIDDGYGDNGWNRDYSGLEATVGRTTRFMSLQRDIDSHRLRPELGEHNRFDRTGIYMEKYIEKDIIQYQSTSSGGLEVVRSIEGASMFGWLDLVG